MKKPQKKLLLAMAVAMCTTVVAGNPVWSTPVYAASASFSDVPQGHWAYGAVSQLVKNGCIDGYSDGTFKGDKAISRYEFAIIVTKALDKYDKADQNSKDLMDKLSSEFNKELNTLGTRVAKVENKTKVWLTNGDIRFRYFSDSPNEAIKSSSKLRGADGIDWWARFGIKGELSPKTTMFARFTTGKTVAGANTSGANVSFEAANITSKHAFGLDEIEIGRDAFKWMGYGMMGKPGYMDGIAVQQHFGKVNFTGFTGMVKDDPTVYNAKVSVNDPEQITTAQLGFKPAKNLEVKTGYFWSDIPGSTTSALQNLNVKAGSFRSSNGAMAAFKYKFDKYTLFGDFYSTKLNKADKLPDNPKGFAVELTNGVGPYIFYGATALLVNHQKPHTDAWMVRYASIDAGTLPVGLGGFDTLTASYGSYPYNTYWHGSDNIKALVLAYQNVISQSTVLSLEYHKLNIKDRSLTDLPSSYLNKVWATKVQFFF
jgi:hypothetical protein